MYAKFDVYVNAVDEITIGPESREFAGTFVNMRRGADDDEVIWVSLVPRGRTGLNFAIDGIRIEYMR
ncbi:hypothetical protein MKW98_031823 [Papaver atlanticum]|uniref:Polyphenol oxidase C-terminal domain-containing protein n=1 Tax=Papaver atlanticum TaxID=357466 RepID=A0AAD4SEN1_9MAGN|nr:hypothetical protein MKW98_031823 [Papaver atlanticum]